MQDEADEKRKEKANAETKEEEYDEEYGYGGGLFNDVRWDADDDEADRIYQEVDMRMDQRRKERREQREREEMEKHRKERPKLQAQFADAKAELSTVSLEEWENLPEVGDVRAKRRKTKDNRPERYVRLA